MNTASMVGSVSRLAGGLFESARRLHQELLREGEPPKSEDHESTIQENDAVNVSVLGMRDEFTQSDIGAWHPVPVYTFAVHGPRAFAYAPGLSSKLLALSPELVHVHGLWQYLSLAALAWHRKSRRPYLVSPHGMLDPWALANSTWKKRLGLLAYERSHLSNAACIRVLCQSEADSVQALDLGVPVCIIPNGVDLGAPASRRPLLAGGTKALPGFKLLLYLGRLHPKKGLLNLLRAWTRVPRPDEWRLAIAGWDQGGHEAELKRIASQLGIGGVHASCDPKSGETVFFLGPQFGAAKRDWLDRCDAFILPSVSEGLPMAVLEAWARAKPVLITPQCNLPEGFATHAAIRIGPTESGIAGGLEDLFRMPDSSLTGMGSRGRALVASRFTWAKVAADMKSVYSWMLGVGPKPACVISP
jgi:poly(glycerol-phosphate) alpha-glucosyltransferase